MKFTVRKGFSSNLVKFPCVLKINYIFPQFLKKILSTFTFKLNPVPLKRIHYPLAVSDFVINWYLKCPEIDIFRFFLFLKRTVMK